MIEPLYLNENEVFTDYDALNETIDYNFIAYLYDIHVDSQGFVTLYEKDSSDEVLPQDLR